MQIPYEVGKEYNRRTDIHDRFGGSRQAGMCTCANHPVIFLFTGPSGEQHGYSDRFTKDGRFFYTGEGQVGDMAFLRGNKALRDHAKDGRHALLFEQSSNGNYVYRGEFSYIGHHIEARPDREGNSRSAIVFELALEPLDIVKEFDLDTKPLKSKKLPKSVSVSDLRQIALTGSSTNVKARTIQSRIYNRSIAVKQYALARAKGICECCGKSAPFFNIQNEPYLEVHHMHRIADAGPDTPDGVAAICPTCHRNIHYGLRGKELNCQLIEKIASFEALLW